MSKRLTLVNEKTPAKLSSLFDDNISDISRTATPTPQTTPVRKSATATPYRSPLKTPLSSSKQIPDAIVTKKIGLLARFFANSVVFYTSFAFFLLFAACMTTKLASIVVSSSKCGKGLIRFGNICGKAGSDLEKAYNLSQSIGDYVREKGVTDFSKLREYSDAPVGILENAVNFNHDLHVVDGKIVRKLSDRAESAMFVSGLCVFLGLALTSFVCRRH